jgi:hypothetical protein
MCSCSCRSTQPAYVYLLGLFLGDGCLAPHPRTWCLRFSLDEAYPEIVTRCRESLLTIAPDRKISVARRRRSACVVVGTYWQRWPDYFPHTGAGHKHTRRIALEDWQQTLVTLHPWQFLRGLLESDDCRSINRVRTVLPSGREALYEYPRWYFVNASEDILGLFAWACRLVGVHCTRSRRRMITVSRRGSVALLDDHVGPKA